MIKIQKLAAVLLIQLLFVFSVNAQSPADAARLFPIRSGNTGANLNTSGGFGLLPYDFESVGFNPAMSALFKESHFGMYISDVYSGAHSSYLNEKSSYSENSFSFDSFFALFKLPTYQGSLAISAGYQKTADFHNVFTAQGFNTTNSIADVLAETSDPALRLIAYNGYATDSIRVSGLATGDLKSILRFGNSYPGLDQYIEQVEYGTSGDFIMNFSTEWFKNVFAGLTIGIPISNYSYSRTYFEQDKQNSFNTYPSDVKDLLVSENVDTYATGVYGKLGIVFKPVQWLNLGLSYQTPYNLEVNDSYKFSVKTRFDDGTEPSDDFPNKLDGKFTYTLKNPQLIQLGIGIHNFHGFDAGFTMDYKSYNNLAFKSKDKAFELNQNMLIRQTFTDIFSFNGGLGYDFSGFKPQVGFAYIPSYYKNAGVNYTLVSGGFQVKLAEGIMMNLGVQYHTLSQNSTLYESVNFGTSPKLKTDSKYFTAQVGWTFAF